MEKEQLLWNTIIDNFNMAKNNGDSTDEALKYVHDIIIGTFNINVKAKFKEELVEI